MLTPARIAELVTAIKEADEPERVFEFNRRLELMERFMFEAGLYSQDRIRDVTLARMLARWKLGQLLRKEARDTSKRGPRGTFTAGVKGLNAGFRALLERVGVTPPVALEAQRIGALPEKELEKLFAEVRGGKRAAPWRRRAHGGRT
jgi:hypothetical protein